MGEPIKVTITDPETGEVLGDQILDDDYVLICAGNRYLDSVQNYPAKGTTTLVVKTDRGDDAG